MKPTWYAISHEARVLAATTGQDYESAIKMKNDPESQGSHLLYCCDKTYNGFKRRTYAVRMQNSRWVPESEQKALLAACTFCSTALNESAVKKLINIYLPIV